MTAQEAIQRLASTKTRNWLETVAQILDTHPDSVLECNTSDLQRLEEGGNILAIVLNPSSSSRSWVLSRSEEWDIRGRGVVEDGHDEDTS